jgi:hypothetical protein
VVAEIEDDEVVVREEVLPERKIGVRSEPVAVSNEQPRAVWIAVPAQADARAVVQTNIEGCARGWDHETHATSAGAEGLDALLGREASVRAFSGEVDTASP